MREHGPEASLEGRTSPMQSGTFSANPAPLPDTPPAAHLGCARGG